MCLRLARQGDNVSRQPVFIKTIPNDRFWQKNVISATLTYYSGSHPNDMRIQKLIACLLLALTALSAAAIDRLFPANAKRGTISFENYPTVTIDGTARNLSAGLRIWNTNNLTQVQASYTGMSFIGNYTEDSMGQVNRIWILTAAELAKPAPNTSSSTGTSTSTSTDTSGSTSTTSSTQ